MAGGPPRYLGRVRSRTETIADRQPCCTYPTSPPPRRSSPPPPPRGPKQPKLPRQTPYGQPTLLAFNAPEYCTNRNNGRCEAWCPHHGLHTCSLCGGAETPAGHRRIHRVRNANPPRIAAPGAMQTPAPRQGPKGKGKGNKKQKLTRPASRRAGLTASPLQEPHTHTLSRSHADTRSRSHKDARPSPTAHHPFSGDRPRSGGLAALPHTHGWDCSDIDIVTPASQGGRSLSQSPPNVRVGTRSKPAHARDSTRHC